MIIGSFSSKILAFLIVPFYTSILSTEEYGIIDLISTSVNLVIPFFTVLMAEAILRFCLDNNYEKNNLFTTGLITIFVGSVPLSILSSIIIPFTIIRGYTILFLIYYYAYVIHNYIAQFCKGINHVATFTISSIINTFSFLILNVFFLAYLDLNIKGYLYALILSNLISTLYIILIERVWKYISHFNKEYFKEMVRYAIPLVPNSVSWWVSNSSDKYLMTYICGISASGIYSVAYKVPSLFSTISSIFVSAWQLSAVDDFGTDESKKFFSNIYNLYSSFNIVIVSVIILISKFLSTLLFSNEFSQAWRFVPILLIAYLFNAMSGFVGTVFTTAKITRPLLTSTLIAAIANVIINIVLIPFIGGLGAGIATFISYFLVWIIRLKESHKIIKLNIDYKRDVTCYCLIIMEIILIEINSLSVYIVAFITTLVILIIERHIFTLVYSQISKHLIHFLHRG